MLTKRLPWLGFALATICLSAEEPQTADELYREGVSAFEQGRIDASVDAFDALVAKQPDRKPELWQRGISLYYANRLAECVC